MSDTSSTNGNGNGAAHKESAPAPFTDKQLETVAAMVNNFASSRRDWIRLLTDPRRNIEKECGYPEGPIEVEFYQNLYNRFSIAARVVKLLPREMWQVQPSVYEDEDPGTDTDFEAAWNELGQGLRGEQCWHLDQEGSAVWEYLQRVDELSGIGQYGVLLLGFDDGQPLNQPLKARAVRTGPLVSKDSTKEFPTGPQGDTSDGTDVPPSTKPAAKSSAPKPRSPSKFGKKPPTGNTLTLNQLVAMERPSEVPEKIKTQLVENAANFPSTGTTTYDVDGTPFQKQAQYDGREMPGDPAKDFGKTPKGFGKPSAGGPRLTYLRVFPEALAPVIQFETNVASPRYGQPVSYLLTFNDPRGNAQGSGVGLSSASMQVHWTRVIHVADTLESSEVFGQPRMRPHVDHLLALKKVYGASGEGYWKSSFVQVSWQSQDGDTEVNIPAMRAVIEAARNSLQPDLLTQGLTANPIAPNVVDPTAIITAHLTAIAIEIGCPMRVLMGSERGQLASGQDDGKWNDVVKQRWFAYAVPRLVCPFVDRLIAVGTLPEPEGGYKVHVPDLESATAASKAAVLLQRTQAYGSYVAQGVEAVVPPLEYMTKFDDLSIDEAQSILDSAEQHQEETQANEMQQQQDMIDQGLAPDPTKPSPDLTAKIQAGTPASGGKGAPFPPKPSLNYDPDQSRAGDGKWTRKVSSAEDVEGSVNKVDLNLDQLNAFDYYNGRGYRQVNAHLRTGKRITGPIQDKVDHAVKHLDSAMDSSKTTNNLTLLRGFSVTDHESTLKVGGEFSDPSYMSTTVDEDTAKRFSRTDGDVSKTPVLAKIHLPAGSKAYNTGGFLESEVLLPRGSKFTVRHKEVKDGIVHVVLQSHDGITSNTFSQEDLGAPLGELRGIVFNKVSVPEGGHWVTYEGKHLYVLPNHGGFYRFKKGKKNARSSARGEAGGGRGGDAGAGGRVAGKTGAAGSQGGDRGGDTPVKSAGDPAVDRVPVAVSEATARIDRMANLFRKKGQHQAAEWMDKLKHHVETTGNAEDLLKSLGESKGKGTGEKVAYGGVDTEESPNWKSSGDFIKAYLERTGIVPIIDQVPDSKTKVIHSQTNDHPFEKRGKKAIDFQPVGPAYDDKLQESKDLPGLEKSEDIGKIMGKKVTHLTPEVLDKMNSVYGTDNWLIKTYGDYAFAGQGIFFPQRVRQMTADAKSTIWSAGEHLDKYGFKIARDPGTGEAKGIVHSSGDLYRFGSKKYNEVINGDARHWGDKAAAAAENEQGVKLPFGGKDFMVQPAFAAVGVSEKDRAEGKTIAPGEGRVHIVIRNGKAEAIPHATWIKGESLPVVFETADTKAMAKAAEDAINALPAKARAGQIYAPDVLKTKDGYKVVELNASVEYGGSGYLSDNPLVIDSFVSHLTNRDPAHVRFIRNLLTKKALTKNMRWAILSLNYDPDQPRGDDGKWSSGSSHPGSAELPNPIRKREDVFLEDMSKKLGVSLGRISEADAAQTSKRTRDRSGDSKILHALAAHGVLEGSRAYRGLAFKNEEDAEKFVQSKTGSGYYKTDSDHPESFTDRKHIALDFAQHHSTQVMGSGSSKSAEQGAHGVVLHVEGQGGELRGYKLTSDEHEVILPKNQAYKVVEVTKETAANGFTTRHVKLKHDTSKIVTNYSPDQPRASDGKFGHGIVATLKGIGSKVKHAEHVAKIYAEDRIADAVGRLPAPAQTVVKHAFALGKTGTKALFATWIAGQHAAERISRAKGSTVEQARKLRGLLSGIDIAVMKPIQIALGSTGLGHAALPASFIPPATAAYLAYSTARHPLATIRAAGAAVLEASRGAYTKLKKWSNPPKTGPYSAFARNEETLDGVESYLADTLEHYGYSDWFVALLSASLDLTGDLASALDLAQKAANHFPEDTSSPQEDDAEKILGGSMVENSFCKTGEGGGVDPSCSPGGKSGKEKFIGAKVGKAGHVHSAKVEQEVAAATGTEWEDDNKAYDVREEGRHAMEVKTFQNGGKNVISVHPDALLRKVKHIKENPTEVYHTVVLDDRDTFEGGKHAAKHSGHRVYYKRGSGRYNIRKMHKVDSIDQLRKLMDTPDKDLPKEARGGLPKGKALAKLKAQAESAHASRLAKDREYKARKKAGEV